MIPDDEIERVKKQLKTIKKQVEWILENYERAREDDTYLVWLWGRFFRNMPYVEEELFRKLWAVIVHADTIKRIRRKLNEEGRYLPDDITVLKRRRREAIMKEVMPNV